MQVGRVVLGFVHIDPKEKATSLPDGFIEKPFNVHIEQRQRSKKNIRFYVRFRLV